MDLDHFEVNKLYLRLNEWKRKFDAKMQGFDGLLTPAQFHCAFKNEDADELCTIHDYFYLFNMIHYPAGIVPVAQVTPQTEAAPYSEIWTDMIAGAIRNSQQGSAGMPLAI